MKPTLVPPSLLRLHHRVAAAASQHSTTAAPHRASLKLRVFSVESCNSRAFNYSGWNHDRMQSLKVGVYNEILSRLRELNAPEVTVPDFEDELWVHFYLLPTRYALDMNVERAQDVLMHKRLQQMARAIASGPAVEVRVVQVNYA